MKKASIRLLSLLLSLIMILNLSPYVSAATDETDSLEDQLNSVMDEISTDQEEAKEYDINPYSTDLEFTLINETYEYGQDTRAVIIDMGEEVLASSITTDSFSVDTVNTDAGETIYAGNRNVIEAYVSDEKAVGDKELDKGRYIVIELEVGFGLAGAGTLNFDVSTFRNNVMDLAYSLTQIEDITFDNGNVIASGDVTFIKAGEINLVADDFEYYELDGMTYRLFTPEDTSVAQSLVLWLHGVGESGTNNESQMRANMGATTWATDESQAENPSYVLAPQTSSGWSDADFEAIKAIIDEMISEGKVDSDRIYVVGCSMGGGGTLRILQKYPELFTAAIPICPLGTLTEETAETIKDIPMWFVHAANDPSIPVQSTRDNVELLKSIGAENVFYTEYEDVGSYDGHWSWVYVTNNEYVDDYGTDYMTWLHSQTKSSEDDPQTDFEFTLINETYEYGQDTVALAIDMGKDVDASCTNNSQFYIYVTSTNADTGAIVSDNVRRTLLYAYVSDEMAVGDKNLDSGRYLILEMQVGYQVAGATTLASSSHMILDYTIVQRRNIVCTDGTVYSAGNITFIQSENMINLIADDFGYYTYEGGVLDTQYRLYTPENPDNESMPLVVWIHGGGESGTNNESQLLANMGATSWASPENQAERPCYVLAPQTDSGWGYTDVDNVAAIIEELLENENIDPNRVYVTGCSRGGAGTLRILFRHPELFAAGIPICPANDIVLYEEQAEKMVDIPLWFVQASNDTTVPAYITRGRVELLSSLGATIRFTEFENNGDYSGHWSWVHVGNNEYVEAYGTDFMTWLFEQEKTTIEKDYDFQLINQVYAYGQDVRALVIDAGAQVNSSSINADTFTVSAININSETDNIISFSGLRKVTNAYVSESGNVGDESSVGRYIVLELEVGANVEGATTLANGVPLDMYYSVQQNSSFSLADGNTANKGTVRYNQAGEVSLVADPTDFEFTLINETYEYGQDTVALAIDMGKDVDASCANNAQFNLYVTSKNPDTGAIVSDNVRRTLLYAYVSDEMAVGDKQLEQGRYLILEMQVGYQVEGATTLASSSHMILEYTIVHRRNIICMDGTVYTPGSITFTQSENMINLIADDFDYCTYEGTVLDTQYRLYTPENPDDESMPLVVWIHGGGESGTNNESQLLANMGATSWASPENQAERPCYVLAPQTNSGWSNTDVDNVAAIINELLENENIDANRVYIVGCSRGGAGTLRLLSAYSDLFAAGIPICPANDYVLTQKNAEKMVDIPLWFVQASNDTTVPAYVTRSRVELLSTLGATVRFTEFEDNGVYDGHWSWTHVGNNEYVDAYGTDFMTWLFEQEKSSIETDYDFQLINEVYEYGQNVKALVIDAGAQVNGSSLNANTFTVSAINMDSTSTNYTVRFSGLRKVTNAYVSESGNVGDESSTGRYIILELEVGYSVEGATTLANSNPLDMYYSVQQTSSLSISDGSTVNKGTVRYNQAGEVNLVVDDFEYGEQDGMPYRIYTPEDTFEAQPLVLWLHGGGESGTNNESQMRANMGATSWATSENQAERSCYVLAPQTNSGWSDADFEAIKAIIDELVSDGKVDADQIYVVGCSRGGQGTIGILAKYSDLFAAAIPICPAGTLSKASATTIKDIPMWFVQSANDTTVSVENTRAKIELLESVGAKNVLYTEYENVGSYLGHWAWIYVANNDYVDDYGTDYMTWLFSQNKSTQTYTVTATANSGGTVAAETLVQEGDNAELTFKANNGYKLVSILVDGISVDISDITNDVYTIENVQSNMTARVLFMEDKDHTEQYTDLVREENGNRTWYMDAVNIISGLGIMQGDGNGIYRPEDTMTRAEFSKMVFELADALGMDPQEADSVPFEDMPYYETGEYWAVGVIGWAYENGIVKGYDSNTFGPEDIISRQDMAVMMQRFFEEYAQVTLPGNASTTFTDANEIGSWAVDAVNYAVRTGLMNGYDDDTFQPTNGSRRVEVAQVFYNYINYNAS